MYHMNLKELTVGQPITGYYILRSGKTVTTSEGKTFYCATVLDGSGTMDVRCWQNADNSVDEKTIGEVVYLEGEIKLYWESRQICCRLLRPANEKDAGEYELTQLIPATKSMREDVARYIARIKDTDYHDLCLGVLDEYGEAYFTAPGGLTEHHNFPGGLAAHSCHMAALADGLTPFYGASLNIDLLRAGCLLHDLGKIQQLCVASTGFAKGFCGKEHAETGARMILEVGKSLSIRESKLQAIVHLIRAHHDDASGTMRPSLPEAFALRRLDQMDCEMDAIFSTRSSIPNGQLSGWNHRMHRVISFVA